MPLNFLNNSDIPVLTFDDLLNQFPSTIEDSIPLEIDIPVTPDPDSILLIETSQTADQILWSPVEQSPSDNHTTTIQSLDQTNNSSDFLTFTGSSGSFIAVNSSAYLNAVSNDIEVTGTTGHDVLVGNLGNEILIGGEGDDLLIDGMGRNTFIGGTGKDIFLLSGSRFNRTLRSQNLIMDFSKEDVIVLDQNTFPKLHLVSTFDGKMLASFDTARSLAEARRSSSTLVYLRKGREQGSLFYNENGKRAGFGQGGKIAEFKNKPTARRLSFQLINSLEPSSSDSPSSNPPSSPPPTAPGNGSGGNGEEDATNPFNTNPFYSPHFFGSDAYFGRPFNALI
jgi:RTX calcium-binding nonapeptide repeat (4 copies)